MVLFPTEQWLDEYGRRLTRHEALDTVAAGWGRDFNGDLLVVIEDVPVEETTVGELPEGVIEGLSGTIVNRLPALSEISVARAPEVFTPSIRFLLGEQKEDLLRQLEESVVDGTIYAFIGLEDGVCTEVETLSSPDERDSGLVVRGSYETWNGVIHSGEFVPAVLSGALTVRGDRVRLLKYLSMLELLGDIAGTIPTTSLFPTDDSSVGTPAGRRDRAMLWMAKRTLAAHRSASERFREPSGSAPDRFE